MCLLLSLSLLPGQLPPTIDADKRKIDVLDVSDNDGIYGTIPDSYSNLSMLFAEGTSLSDSALPDYVRAASAADDDRRYYFESIHNSSVCPAFETFANGNRGSISGSVVAMTMDPAYDGYSVCTCQDG